MRVLITTGIFPPDIGGPATFVPNLATALAAREHKVTVLTLSENSHPDDRSFLFPVLRIPRSLPIARRVPETALRIARAARYADVLFSNGLFEETALATSSAATPWVVKIVGDWVWERARNLKWTTQEILDFHTAPPMRARWQRIVQRWVITRAHRIIVPSLFLRRLVEGWGADSRRITVIPNAVDQTRVQVKSEAKRRLGLHGVVVLFVGRLVSWKNVGGILEATTGLPAELVIVGDGPERVPLERLARDLGRVVRFVGAQPVEATAEYFAAADIFVLNSTYEGFPHVVLEAMVAGAAVVAVSAGGTPEVVQQNRTGLLVPPHDPAALREAIGRLLSNPELRASLTERGRVYAAQFTWEAVAARILEVLTDVAGGRGLTRDSVVPVVRGRDNP